VCLLSFPCTRRTLDAELEPLLLSKAAQFNLPQEWVSQLDKLDPERRQVGGRGGVMRNLAGYLNPAGWLAGWLGHKGTSLCTRLRQG
jgi:hypothetical protein